MWVQSVARCFVHILSTGNNIIHVYISLYDIYIRPPPPTTHTHTQNKRHNPVFDQGEVFPRQQWGSHPVSGTRFFSVSFRFNFMGPTKGETKKHQIEFT